MNNKLRFHFIFLCFYFLVSFYFVWNLNESVMVTQLCDTEKNIESSRIDNVI